MIHGRFRREEGGKAEFSPLDLSLWIFLWNKVAGAVAGAPWRQGGNSVTFTFSREQRRSLGDQLGRGVGGAINRYAKRHKIRRQVDISDCALTDLCVTWIGCDVRLWWWRMLVCVFVVCLPLPTTTKPPFVTTLCISDPSASLPEENASIFCAVLQGFPLMTPGTACACPLFIFNPPSPHIKKGRDGEGVGWTAGE